MTREDVLAMPAGAALDALVAERVLKQPPERWRSRCYVERHNFDDYEYDPQSHVESGWCYTCRACVGDLGGKLPPPVSTDMTAAWRLAEHAALFQSEPARRFGAGRYEKWGVVQDDGDGAWTIVAEADTAPLAICRAALLTTLA